MTEVIQTDWSGFRKYYYSWLIILAPITFGISLLYLIMIGRWHSQKWPEEYRAEYDERYLYLAYGVFWKSKKAIALDRITDFHWVQGPLMRWCGMSIIKVQTASSVNQWAEGIIWCPSDPQALIDKLKSLKANI